MLLAIDTSTNTPSIALYDAQGVMGEMTWRTREHHTRSLMPEITRLLQLLGASVNQLRAIAVATGPGSFTGLRIGLSAAKGLAYSSNAALLGIPTLDITASAGAGVPLPICAVLLAGRGRYAAAMYHAHTERPTRASEYFFGAADALVSQLAPHLTENFYLTGETDENLYTQLQAAFGARVNVAPRAAQLRRAGYLAQLAWRRWQAGERDDVTTLAPFYIPTAALA